MSELEQEYFLKMQHAKATLERAKKNYESSRFAYEQVKEDGYDISKGLDKNGKPLSEKEINRIASGKRKKFGSVALAAGIAFGGLCAVSTAALVGSMAALANLSIAFPIVLAGGCGVAVCVAAKRILDVDRKMLDSRLELMKTNAALAREQSKQKTVHAAARGHTVEQEVSKTVNMDAKNAKDTYIEADFAPKTPAEEKKPLNTEAMMLMKKRNEGRSK